MKGDLRSLGVLALQAAVVAVLGIVAAATLGLMWRVFITTAGLG